MYNKENLHPSLLEEYERYIKGMMKDLRLTRKEAELEMEERVQELMDEYGWGYEVALMASMDGW